jgi:Spy/CpxP family protein refolding chaperone
MKKTTTMRIITILTVFLVFLTTCPAGADTKPPALQPVAHEELGNMLDELTTHLQGLGIHLHRHFREWGQPGKRALITFMLRRQEELGLSTDQVKKLGKLRSNFELKTIRWQADIRIAEMELEALLDADPADMKEVEAKVRDIERLRAEHRLARIRTIEEGKTLLTKEQKGKLSALLTGSKHRRDYQ